MIQKLKTHIKISSSLGYLLVANSVSAATIGRIGFTGSLTDLINRILGYVLVIAGLIAVIYLIFGGFKYLTSGGNDKAVTEAKNTIMYAIVGLIIIAAAFAIKSWVFSLIGVAEPTQLP